MALAAGDQAIMRSALRIIGRPTPPLFGTVESTNPWVIAWENGQRQSYAAVDPLWKAVSAVNADYNNLFYKYVRSTGGLGDGQRYEGVVVHVMGVETNAGAAIGDFVVIELEKSKRYVVTLASLVELVPNR